MRRATLFENLKCEKQSFSTFEIMPTEKKVFSQAFKTQHT